jgi:hypothetical protein
MVVLLNGVWVLVSFAAAWVWLHWRSRSRYPFSAQVFSLGCALIILFPVVSANDDLYVQQAAIETSDRQKIANVDSGKSVRQSFHAPVVFSSPEPVLIVRPQAVVVRAAKSKVAFRSISTFSPSFLDRAPPLLTLA